MTPPCTSTACKRACPCPAACQLPEVIGEDEDGPILPLSADDAAGLIVCICIAFVALAAVLSNLPG